MLGAQKFVPVGLLVNRSRTEYKRILYSCSVIMHTKQKVNLRPWAVVLGCITWNLKGHTPVYFTAQHADVPFDEGTQTTTIAESAVT